MLKIKEVREQKNITQDDMVAKTGIPKRSYVDYENGKSDIQLSKLQKIATALDVTVGYLIGETKNENLVINKNDNNNDNFFDIKPKVKNKLSTNTDVSGIDTNNEYDLVMRKLKFSDSINISNHGAPFYNLPVSAGRVNELIDMEEIPTGYINMPGINCDAYFPITGASFEPYIRAGDIIGINFIDKWENLDPDCVYLIITYDQRMLKRLMKHPTDSTLLICVSPNYKEFEIDKFTIRYIHKVTFCGRSV
ncbi:LexA family transcriptional regulator [Chryseobacterium arthrosphaerae]|uniref:XRE family transcriptional regulator n=1 Tax=Chryseobacterium arthrosphaerae TaxID=651561 RepID=UPI000F50BE61|nr:LexA family transcriptional regulator [Chryseobacterium arthrosphaerae]AYZ12921.1 LexA family transcriptional regulator [Chryseobacterium arthrosphaerae]